jgi:protein involved in polysaccharide export with SLBB domain
MMQISRRAILAAVLGVPLVAGCATKVKLDPATVNVAQGLSTPYRVHPGDILEIKFKYHPADNTTATVDTDGRLNIPMAGELQVSGLLLPELEQLIRERASRYMRDPVVNVTVATSESKAYIGGEVIDEGFVTLTRPMTVLQAVFERGGFTPGADLSDVVILSHEEGKAVSRLIDLEAELEGDPSERTLLAADEIVFVPKTAVAKANQFVDEYINKMMPDFLTRMIRFNPIGP